MLYHLDSGLLARVRSIGRCTTLSYNLDMLMKGRHLCNYVYLSDINDGHKQYGSAAATVHMGKAKGWNCLDTMCM